MKLANGIVTTIIGTAVIVSSTYFFVLTKKDKEEVNEAIHKTILAITHTKENIAHTIKKENEEIDQSLEALQESVRRQWIKLDK